MPAVLMYFNIMLYESDPHAFSGLDASILTSSSIVT